MDQQVAPASWRTRAYPWYVVVLLLLTYMVSSIDRTAISVIVEPLKAEFKVSDAQIGLLGGIAFSAPFALASLPMGWIVDRVNRVLLLAIMLVTWSSATMLSALPTTFALLVACRMLVGAAESGAHPASLSLIADYFEPRRRASAISLFAVGAALGTFAVYFGGGWLQYHFSWRAVFLIAGIPGFILALVIILTVRDPGRGRFDAADVPAGQKGLSFIEAIRLVLRTRPLLHAVVAHMLATGAQFAIVTWVVSLLVRGHGMSVQSAAIWVGLGMGIMQTVGSLLAGPVVDRITQGSVPLLARWLVFVALAGCATNLLLVSVSGAELALAVLCVQTFCAGLLTGPSYTLLVGTSPAQARGSALSVARLMGTLIGNSGLAFLAGFVSDLVGGPSSIAVGLGVSAIGFVWAAFHYRRAGLASASP